MAEFEVPRPIICSPFGEPLEHWLLEEGTEPSRVKGRRPSHYFYRVPGQDPGTSEGAPVGERIDLPLVNLVRARVQDWRNEAGRAQPARRWSFWSTGGASGGSSASASRSSKRSRRSSSSPRAGALSAGD